MGPGEEGGSGCGQRSRSLIFEEHLVTRVGVPVLCSQCAAARLSGLQLRGRGDVVECYESITTLSSVLWTALPTRST